MTKTLLATTALFGLACAPSFAQTGTPSPGGQSLSQQDQRFVKQAANGQVEVEIGRYVLDHGGTPAVRTFARWMVTDHTMADKMLHRTAQAAGAEVPGSLDREAQDMVARIQKLRGAELDRTYIRDMVEDHTKDVQAFQQEAQSGQNPQLKSLAQDLLPALQQHLAAAQDIQKAGPGK